MKQMEQVSAPKTVKMPEKPVYFFAAGQTEGNAGMKNILGGKGANLAEMTSLGLPVPSRIHDLNRDVPGVLRRW